MDYNIIIVDESMNPMNPMNQSKPVLPHSDEINRFCHVIWHVSGTFYMMNDHGGLTVCVPEIIKEVVWIPIEEVLCWRNVG